jgi:hypothetical protein
MLNFFPERCKCNFKNRLTFSEWLKTGSFTPLLSDGSRHHFDSYQIDIASVILTEVEFLYNSIFEQALELFSISQSTKNRSNAWAVVSLYYFSFYVVQAYLRLTGNPISFLDSASLSNFNSITSKKLGGGSYILTKETDISSTNSTYQLRRLDGRFHDSSWRKLFTSIEDLLKTPNAGRIPQELLLFSSITNKKLHNLYSNYSWPSDVRNKANYRLGFAYLLIEKGSILNICKCIAQFPKCNDKIESRLQNALISCHNSNEIKYFDSHVTMLFHVSVGLFQIVKHLYDDLTSRRHIDRRMHNKREKFVSDIEAQFGKPSFIS